MGTSTTKKPEKLVELIPLLRKAAEKSPVTPDEFMYFKKILPQIHTKKKTYGSTGKETVHDEWLRKMSLEEYEKLLSILKKRTNFAVVPMSTSMGFPVGFLVCSFQIKIVPRRHIKSALMFMFSETCIPGNKKGKEFFCEFVEPKQNVDKVFQLFGEEVKSYDYYGY